MAEFPDWEAVRAIFDGYIAGELDATEASLQLTAPVVNAGGDISIEGCLWVIWGVLLNVVCSIACSDPAHDALVALLASVKQLPTPVSTPAFHAFEQGWGKRSFWQDLPIFGPTVRENWNFKPYHGQLPMPENVSSDYCTVSQWVSENAFVARVSAAHVQDFSCYGIWSMRDAFEEDLRTSVELDNTVPAAAVWVLYAGDLMYDLAQKEQPPDDIANASNGGPLWLGRIWYSIERWTFWKQGFSAAMRNSELDSWTREMAAGAHQKMEQIEHEASCYADKGDS